MTDQHDFERAILLLDASLDALDAAASLEARREAGKPMRQITEQQRAKHAREFVCDMTQKYGLDLGDA